MAAGLDLRREVGFAATPFGYDPNGGRDAGAITPDPTENETVQEAAPSEAYDPNWVESWLAKRDKFNEPARLRLNAHHDRVRRMYVEWYGPEAAEEIFRKSE